MLKSKLWSDSIPFTESSAPSTENDPVTSQSPDCCESMKKFQAVRLGKPARFIIRLLFGFASAER